MKTTFLTAAPFLALATFAGAQEARKPDAHDNSHEGAAAVTTPSQTLPFNIPKGRLEDAVELVQQVLEATQQQRLNVIFSIPPDKALVVPELTLRNVTGPDALTLLATAAECELRPIAGTTSGDVIGWEFRPLRAPQRWEKRTGGDPAGAAGSGSTFGGSGALGSLGGAAPGMPGMGGGLGGAPTSSIEVSGGISGTISESGDVGRGAGGGLGGLLPSPEQRVPALSEVPIVNRLFIASSQPSLTTAAGTMAEGGGAPSPMPSAPARSTRVYALGTVTSTVPFAGVEKTLMQVLESDGIKVGEIKLSFHEQTNVLVVNGPERAHKLVDQLILALTKDSAVRTTSSEQQAIELAERRSRQLKEMEEQSMDMFKKVQELEIARTKLETELKLLKERGAAH